MASTSYLRLQKLNKNGFLAVTATDTASITGSSKTASMRRYGSHIFNCENKKELSLRVLATHIIKQAAKLDLKLTPIISYTVKHYARIYFKSEPGKKKVDKHLEKINSFYFCNKSFRLNFSPSPISIFQLSFILCFALLTKPLPVFLKLPSVFFVIAKPFILNLTAVSLTHNPIE